MEITLKKVITEEQDNGEKKVSVEEKTYNMPYAPMSAYLDYLEIAKGDKLTTENIKKYAELIVKTYQNQFTVEEFMNGVPAYAVIDTISAFISDLTRDPYAELKPEGNGKKEKK